MTVEQKNPYVAGAPITDPNIFFGRQDVFDWIRDNLANHALVIHGQRRVGKTSVLRQLARHLPAGTLPVYYDLQGRTSSSLELFLFGLAREITRVVQTRQGVTLPQPSREAFENDVDYFERVYLRQVNKSISGQTLLICLDEFDLLEDTPVIDKNGRPLQDLIRRLLNTRWINFIFSIGSSGRKLEYMKAAFTALFKTALYKKVTFLSRGDSVRLMVDPVQETLEYSREAMERIYALSSGHPYYIQLICHEVFSQFQKHGRPRVEVADVDAVLDDVVERGTVNLKFIWDEATPLEKWLLVGLSQTANPAHSLEELVDFLGKQGIGIKKERVNNALLHLREKEVLTENNSFLILLLEMWLQKNWPVEKVQDDIGRPAIEPIELTGAPLVELPTPARSGLKLPLRRWLAWGSIGILLVLLMGFGIPKVIEWLTATPTPTIVGDVTITPTITQTNTPEPTIRPSQTITSTPTLTLTPTSIFAGFPVISPETAHKLTQRFATGKGRVFSTVIAADGKHVIYGGSGGIDIYDIASKDLLHHIPTSSLVEDFALTKDPSVITASLLFDDVIWFSISTGEIIRSIPGFDHYALSPDGFTLAGATGQNLRILDLTNGNSIGEFSGHQGWIHHLAFSPDGKYLATASEDKTVHVWRTSDWKTLWTFRENTNPVIRTAFTPDSRYIASLDHTGKVYLWDVKNGLLWKSFGGEDWSSEDLDFSPDGKTLIVGEVYALVRFWDITTQKQIYYEKPSFNDRGYDLSFSLDGNLLSIGGDGTAMLVNMKDTNDISRIHGYNGTYWDLAISPDAKTIAVGSSDSDDESMHMFDAFDGTRIQTNSFSDEESIMLYSVAYSPDGQWLAAGSDDQRIHLWNVKSGVENSGIKNHTELVRTIAIASDNKRMASGSWDDAVWLYFLEEGKFIKSIPLEKHTAEVKSVAFSPDGKLLASGSMDGSVMIWNAENGSFLSVLEKEPDEIYDVAFSPDGRFLATSAWGEKTARVALWDTQTLELVKELKTESSYVRTIAFSPDGKIIAAGDGDKIVLYEVDTAAILVKEYAHTFGVYGLSFSSDGRLLVSTGHDGIVREWVVSDE